MRDLLLGIPKYRHEILKRKSGPIEYPVLDCTFESDLPIFLTILDLLIS